MTLTAAFVHRNPGRAVRLYGNGSVESVEGQLTRYRASFSSDGV